jgi:hypothetical protein
MVMSVNLDVECGGKVPETVLLCGLGENHGGEMAPGVEVFYIAVGVVFFNQVLELAAADKG